MINNQLNDIVTNGLCIGCGLCESIAGRDKVKIVMTPEGRERPSIGSTHIPLDSLINETIYATCPGTQIHGLPAWLIEPETEIDAVWGPLLRIDRGYAADPDIRFRGSTGGVLTALAIYLLEASAWTLSCMWQQMKTIRCVRAPISATTERMCSRQPARDMVPPPR